jgi:stage II sporulation protein D
VGAVAARLAGTVLLVSVSDPGLLHAVDTRRGSGDVGKEAPEEAPISPRVSAASRGLQSRPRVGSSLDLAYGNALLCHVFAVRRLWVIGSVCCILVGATSASAATELVVTGKGWGHGVGMSQWGAYGYARHGWSWQRILAHYYPGTTLAVASVQQVRVLLGSGQPRASITCAGGIHVGDRSGRGYSLPAGTYGFGAGLMLPVAHKRVSVEVGLHHRERYTLVPVKRALRSPLVFDCPSAPLGWNGRAYHGLLVVRRIGMKLSIVNAVALDDYVSGVVGGEMPHNWSLAALEAQAVASRSYALATLKPSKHFDLFSDARSQVYGGIAYETPGIDFAVRRTAGRVLMWNSQVATTFFFSTSGGRTADIREVWPKAADVPYLHSVDDPYDAASPHHAWGPFTFDAGRLAQRLHLRAGPVRVRRTASGRVASVRVGTSVIDGNTFSRDLGLSSTWFDIGRLSLTAGPERIVYGAKVGIDARADDVRGAVLQRRVGAGAWRTLAHVNGTRSVTVEPQGQTLYRLSARGIVGPVVAIAVAPALHVVPVRRDLLTGDVEPVSRATVTVWRKIPSGWKVVARPQLDPQGQFSAPLRLRPGDYRVDVAASSRFAAADARLDVTPRLLASLH